MTTYVSQRRACKSCPFRKDGDGHFPPESLDASIGKNLRSQKYAHNCHGTNDTTRVLGSSRS